MQKSRTLACICDLDTGRQRQQGLGGLLAASLANQWAPSSMSNCLRFKGRKRESDRGRQRILTTSPHTHTTYTYAPIYMHTLKTKAEDYMSCLFLPTWVFCDSALVQLLCRTYWSMGFRRVSPCRSCGPWTFNVFLELLVPNNGKLECPSLLSSVCLVSED